MQEQAIFFLRAMYEAMVHGAQDKAWFQSELSRWVNPLIRLMGECYEAGRAGILVENEKEKAPEESTPEAEQKQEQLELPL